MKARKIFSVVLAGAAAMSLLAGCSSAANTTSGQSSTGQTAQSQSDEQSAAAGSSSADRGNASAGSSGETGDTSSDSSQAGTTSASGSTGNVLVVYYSATGNTEAVANAIADATGGTLFELEPVEPYTEDDLNWTDDNSRVSVEHENEDQRNVELVSTTVENWDSYDTVFIGYPIWWGIAAWPVNSFVQNNDFTGKTVIPFCTSSSSDLGESGQLLAEMAGTGDWQEGQRFRSGVDDADVQDWVNSLGL